MALIMPLWSTQLVEVYIEPARLDYLVPCKDFANRLPSNLFEWDETPKQLLKRVHPCTANFSCGLPLASTCLPRYSRPIVRDCLISLCSAYDFPTFVIHAALCLWRS